MTPSSRSPMPVRTGRTADCPGQPGGAVVSRSSDRLADARRPCPETMRALQLQALGNLRPVNLSVPEPRPDEVLVRTVASTICTSDLNDIAHNPFGITLPRVPGHEGAGKVVAIGKDVKEFRLGEAVAAHPVIPCGSCVNCGRGLGHLCSRLGHLGLDRDGTFAEYFCVPADRVRRVPAGFDLAVAALLEPVCVCLEALERARVQAGETLLIVGDGPFGLLIAGLARHYRPGRILLVGHHEFRLRHAAGVVPIHGKQVADPRVAVLDANDGQGVDAAILAAGSQAALDLCVSCLRARGRAVVFSAVPPPVHLDLFRVHTQEIEVLGACNDENLIDAGLERLLDPECDLASLITHRLPFEDWRRALSLAGEGKDRALKVAILFGGPS